MDGWMVGDLKDRGMWFASEWVERLVAEVRRLRKKVAKLEA